MSFLSYNVFGLISLMEIFYLVILTLVLGFIFADLVRLRPIRIEETLIKKRFRFGKEEFWFACLVAAPGVILHELSHKFVAMSYGLPAEFNIFWFGIILAVILKLANSPLLIIAPGYVNIGMINDPIAYRLIAFAGPLVNLVLWLGSYLVLKTLKHLNRRQTIALILMSRINMILFIFNMIPIGPLDGAKVIFGA